MSSNIFVTVGSTDFDTLVQTVDEIASTEPLQGIMQIGHGCYEPVHLPYFRFASPLDGYYERASLVIAHGGLATTMEVLRRGLPLISVSNPDRYDNHQDDLLRTMADDGYLVWCRRLDDLPEAITTVQTTALRKYRRPECTIHHVINQFLQ